MTGPLSLAKLERPTRLQISKPPPSDWPLRVFDSSIFIAKRYLVYRLFVKSTCTGIPSTPEMRQLPPFCACSQPLSMRHLSLRARVARPMMTPPAGVRTHSSCLAARVCAGILVNSILANSFSPGIGGRFSQSFLSGMAGYFRFRCSVVCVLFLHVSIAFVSTLSGLAKTPVSRHSMRMRARYSPLRSFSCTMIRGFCFRYIAF
mmetsp:Transcript_65410/g.168359  ORF Transcript_65410/g.168359 Transcript_65410/m.168359 type:complete len:204 (+) Transcript_65410:1553-2164(+)